MFKLHPNNIAQIKAAANHFGEIHFHATGNIYHSKDESDFHKDFSNGHDGPATYRKTYKRGDKFPTSVEELTKDLLNSKTQEVVEASKPKEVSAIATFKVESEDDSAKADAAAEEAKAAEQKAKDAEAKAKADAAAAKK